LLIEANKYSLLVDTILLSINQLNNCIIVKFYNQLRLLIYKGGDCIKTHVIIIILLCFGILSSCSKDSILQFTEEDVQSVHLYTYDYENNETTDNWVYNKNELKDSLKYLKRLSGVKKDDINTIDMGNILYGIEIYAKDTHCILIAGNYAITDKGEYYLIEKKDIEKICKSIVGKTTVRNGINYIYNHRYLSIINGKWNTKYMFKSKWTDTQMAFIQMKSDKTVVDIESEKITLEILNNSSSEIYFITRIEFEVMVDDVWYCIDDMINDSSIGGLVWRLNSYTLDTGESFKDDINLELYQPLPEGKYRLIKEITMNGNTGYVACEFDVN
jgi:hypothetical protein